MFPSSAEKYGADYRVAMTDWILRGNNTLNTAIIITFQTYWWLILLLMVNSYWNGVNILATSDTSVMYHSLSPWSEAWKCYIHSMGFSFHTFYGSSRCYKVKYYYPLSRYYYNHSTNKIFWNHRRHGKICCAKLSRFQPCWSFQEILLRFLSQ